MLSSYPPTLCYPKLCYPYHHMAPMLAPSLIQSHHVDLTAPRGPPFHRPSRPSQPVSAVPAIHCRRCDADNRSTRRWCHLAVTAGTNRVMTQQRLCCAVPASRLSDVQGDRVEAASLQQAPPPNTQANYQREVALDFETFRHTTAKVGKRNL